MDGDRLGPLSYDLTAPTGDAGTERAIVVALLTAAGILAVGLVGGWLVLGVVAKAVYVVDGVPLAILVVPLGLAWLLSRHALHRTRLRALVIVTVIGLFASMLSYRVLHSIKPALPQVQYAIDSIHLPPGYRFVSETTKGDRFCRHGCPGVERHYDAPVGDADPVRTVILAMFAQGWHQTSDVAPELADAAAKGGITAQLSADGRDLRIVAVRDS
jgi:hypothetical protein